jgi:hypothetical protein
MKIFIFLFFIVLIVYALFWYWRKSEAEADLARRESMKRVKKDKKVAITAEDATWPTVGESTSSDLEEDTDSEGPEPPRLYRRLGPLRGWSYEYIKYKMGLSH